MDIIYLFRASQHDNEELRYSLRSVAKHLTFTRKVWVFGDDPGFLPEDTVLIEHVPWNAVAWIQGVRSPVENFFLQTFLVSIHPKVDAEFLLFCDDYILMDRLTQSVAKRNRVLQDLAEAKSRGNGLWKQSLWRTYDLLKRLGYGGLNFETHTPMFMTKQQVFEAYRDLHDYVTEDRFAGMLGPTGILNHAYKQQRFSLTWVKEENLGFGFHDKPALYDQIISDSPGKLFLNFDDAAYGPDMRRYLSEKFPSSSIYEYD